jgi:anti-sigma factor RsiW
MNRPAPREQSSNDREHLTLDQLNAFVDRRFDELDESGLRAHLSTCAQCREELRQLETTVGMLRALPLARPARSFQLTPEMAKVRSSLWSRLARKLLPVAPALRTATVAIAILLIAVGAGDIFTNRDRTPDNVAVLEAPTVVQTAPPTEGALRSAAQAAPESTEPPGIGAGGGAGSTDTGADAEAEPPTEESDGESQGFSPTQTDQSDEDSAETESAAAAAPAQKAGEDTASDEESSAAMNVAPAASPEPAATSTATATPSPSPAPEPTATPAVTTSGSRKGDANSGWRIAEIGLGFLLAIMVAALIILRRAKTKA